MARRTLKDAEHELAKMTAKYADVRAQLTAIQEAFMTAFAGVFVTPEEALDIAHDAVSDRIA